MTKLEISAGYKRGEHFKTPIWIVEVKSAEVPRYTPQELGQRERAKKNRNEQSARQGLRPGTFSLVASKKIQKLQASFHREACFASFLELGGRKLIHTEYANER